RTLCSTSLRLPCGCSPTLAEAPVSETGQWGFKSLHPHSTTTKGDPDDCEARRGVPRRPSPRDRAVMNHVLRSLTTGKEQDIGIPYSARVDERVFLNLPGFHGGAYVLAYVEDTSERDLGRTCDDPTCERCPYNFEPRMILELSDCSRRIELEFDVDSEARRANSL